MGWTDFCRGLWRLMAEWPQAGFFWFAFAGLVAVSLAIVNSKPKWSWGVVSRPLFWVWVMIIIAVCLFVSALITGHAVNAATTTPSTASSSVSGPALGSPGTPAPVTLLPPVVGGGGRGMITPVMLSTPNQVEGELCLEGGHYWSPWYKLTSPEKSGCSATAWGTEYRLVYEDGTESPLIGTTTKATLPNKAHLAFRFKAPKPGTYTIVVREVK